MHLIQLAASVQKGLGSNLIASEYARMLECTLLYITFGDWGCFRPHALCSKVHPTSYLCHSQFQNLRYLHLIPS